MRDVALFCLLISFATHLRFHDQYNELKKKIIILERLEEGDLNVYA